MDEFMPGDPIRLRLWKTDPNFIEFVLVAVFPIQIDTVNRLRAPVNRRCDPVNRFRDPVNPKMIL